MILWSIKSLRGFHLHQPSYCVADFIANLPEAHAGNCLVMVDFNTLFLAGGYGGSAFGYTNKTFILDRITNLWSRMADMPTGRSVLSVKMDEAHPVYMYIILCMTVCVN